MKHEKILDRPDGSKIKLICCLNQNWYENTHEYSVSLFYTKGKGKTFHQLEYDSYTYLRLSKAEQKEYEERELLKHITPAELLGVKMELWNMLKPVI